MRDQHKPAAARVKGTIKPTKFGAESFEQFMTTVNAGLPAIPLWSPFKKRTDPKTGKTQELGKAPRDPRWPLMRYDSKMVAEDCHGNFWNMGYRIQDGVGGLDVDERSGGVASLEKMRKKFPSFDPADYPRAISGGGTGTGGHLLFKIPKGVKLKKSLADDGLPGLEPVCVGRQLVSPGSYHPQSGRMYQWDETHPDIIDGLRELPADVLEFFARKKRDRTEHPNAGIYTCEQVERMLRGLNAADFREYDAWLRVGMSIHYATDGEGDNVWREWSSQDGEHFNDSEIDTKWDSFGTDKADPVTHLHLLKLLHKAGKGNLIPVSTVAAEDDFDDVEDDDDDSWLYDGDPLDDLAERTKANPAAPFEPATLKALAKLQPHELQATFENLKAAGFKKITALTQEVRKATPKKATKKKAETAMHLLQRIVGSECDISLQSDGTVFAQITTDGVVKSINVAHEEFDEWLSYRLFALKQQAASQQTLDDLKRVIVASAKHEDAPTYPSFTRIARFDGAIFLDMCNDSREAIKIDESGWQVVPSSKLPAGFRFVRSAGMQPLPTPAAAGDGDLTLLRGIFNIKQDGDAPSVNDSGFVLLVCYLLSCFTNGPYPILAMDGGAGTAKTTNCELARAVIDPSFSPSRSMPASELDLFVSALSSRIQLFDNLSHIPNWFSDALCRLSTGGGLSKRELFTDAEEILMKARNPVIMNGLHQDMMKRNDLLDRCLIVTLQKITQHKTDEKVRADFAAALPVVLSGLLNMVAHGLRCLPLVDHEGAQTRLADFERWSNACESYLWPEGTFDRVFRGMRSVAKSKLLLRSPVSRALLEFMEDKEDWTGTARELNQRLYAIHDANDDLTPTAPEERWPGALHIFGRRLRDSQGMLFEAYRMTMEFKELDDRTIVIKREMDFG
jgi:hypothetical protein